MGYSPYGMCWLALYRPESSGVEHGVTNLIENEIVREVSREQGCTPAQVLVRWSLQQGAITIPKTASPSRVQESLGALDIELSEAHMQILDGLHDKTRSTQASIDAHLRVIADEKRRGVLKLT